MVQGTNSEERRNTKRSNACLEASGTMWDWFSTLICAQECEPSVACLSITIK
jgi:hypothetical protein